MRTPYSWIRPGPIPMTISRPLSKTNVCAVLTFPFALKKTSLKHSILGSMRNRVVDRRKSAVVWAWTIPFCVSWYKNDRTGFATPLPRTDNRNRTNIVSIKVNPLPDRGLSIVDHDFIMILAKTLFIRQ